MSHESMRVGFGRGLVEVGRKHADVVVLSADLAESTQVSQFKDAFPERFIEVGVAEQNLVTVASGLAHAGNLCGDHRRHHHASVADGCGDAHRHVGLYSHGYGAAGRCGESRDR